MQINGAWACHNTIFSAPNYCGYYDNKAAVLVMEEGNLSLKQYET